MPLDEQLLAMVRGSVQPWLKDRCTIERQSETLDELGSPVHSWEIAAENVPCRVITSGRKSDSAADIIGSAESMTDIYRISLPTTVELDIDYRITVGGQTYIVVRLETALSDEVFTQAIITRHR